MPVRRSGETSHVGGSSENGVAITMDIYDEAVSGEKHRAHRGVIRQVTRQDRSVIRSATISTIPQVPKMIGVPMLENLNQIVPSRTVLSDAGMHD
jgi:hypothetical protein